MRTPIHARDLDLSKITYKIPRDLPNGGSVIYINVDDGPITLQTPKMFCPFGLKDWKGNHSYTLDVSFKGMETDSKMKQFYDKITELDEKILTDGVSNGTLWLKKTIKNKEVASIIYTKQIRYARDKNGNTDERFPPTFKLKVPSKENYFIPDVYNTSKEQIDLNDVETKGATVIAIIQCTGIWTAGGKYGLAWKVMQMIVDPPSGKKFAFVDLDEEAPAAPAAAGPAAAAKAKKPIVDAKPKEKQPYKNKFELNNSDLEESDWSCGVWVVA